MISLLRGTWDGSTLLTRSGVGYLVQANVDQSVGEITLYTHTVMRDSSISIYGFSTVKERELYKELIKIDKVGPATAFSIINKISIEDFDTALENNDLNYLLSLKGIGKSTAEKIYSHFSKNTFKSPALSNVDNIYISALTKIGYDKTVATNSYITLSRAENWSTLTEEERIRSMINATQ